MRATVYLLPILLALSACAAQPLDVTKPLCFIAHSPSVQVSDGATIPSRSTKVCTAYIEIVKE
jgi:hypothetical protein